LDPVFDPLDFRHQLLSEVKPFWEARSIDASGAFWTHSQRDAGSIRSVTLDPSAA
jgi:hypothetical protein